MSRRHVAMVLFAAVTALVTLAGCSSSSSGGHSARPSALTDQQAGGKYAGFGLTPPQPRPQFTLLDENNKPFAFGSRTSDRPTLLFFGYTHCKDDCPDTMADVRLALRAEPAVAKDTVVVFVTTDPARDTGPVERRWLAQFSKGTRATWVGLHGSQAQTDAAQAAAHVALATDHGETHSTQLLLYGPDNYARVSYTVNAHEQGELAHDLPLVAAT